MKTNNSDPDIVVTLEHLYNAVGKLYNLLPNNADIGKTDLEVSLIRADPGNGSIVDTLTIKVKSLGRSSSVEEQEINIEIYPSSEKQLPRMHKSESSLIKDRY